VTLEGPCPVNHQRSLVDTRIGHAAEADAALRQCQWLLAGVSSMWDLCEHWHLLEKRAKVAVGVAHVGGTVTGTEIGTATVTRIGQSETKRTRIETVIVTEIGIEIGTE